MTIRERVEEHVMLGSFVSRFVVVELRLETKMAAFNY